MDPGIVPVVLRASPPLSSLILGLIAAAATSGCETRDALAPLVCSISASTDACLACQARHFGHHLDHCHGVGFHEGRSVREQPPVRDMRCEWDPVAQSYSKNCQLGPPSPRP